MIPLRILWRALPDGVKLAMAAALCAALVGFAAYTAGKNTERARAAERTVEGIERIQDAMDNPNGCTWSERLRGACK